MKQDSFLYPLKLILGFLAVVVIALLFSGCGSTGASNTRIRNTAAGPSSSRCRKRRATRNDPRCHHPCGAGETRCHRGRQSRAADVGRDPSLHRRHRPFVRDGGRLPMNAASETSPRCSRRFSRSHGPDRERRCHRHRNQGDLRHAHLRGAERPLRAGPQQSRAASSRTRAADTPITTSASRSTSACSRAGATSPNRRPTKRWGRSA